MGNRDYQKRKRKKIRELKQQLSNKYDRKTNIKADELNKLK